MIEYNKVQPGKIAGQHGFVRDTFEKVLRLKEILKYFNQEPYLKEHLVLKGGSILVDMKMPIYANSDEELPFR